MRRRGSSITAAVARISPVAAVLAVALAGEAPAHAQDIDFGPIREALSQSLRDIQFAGGLTGLVLLEDELELSGARYSVFDQSSTAFSSLSVPFHTRLRPWHEGPVGLHLEGAIGYASARQGAEDFWGGALPGLETAVDARWSTYGGLLGVGPSFALAPRLALALIGDVGLARIVSDATYDGPGAGFTAAILDGIGLNWDAFTWSWGGAARLDWEHPLGRGFGLEAVGRYDLRWTRAFGADDPAQEFTYRLQLLTLRADAFGPTGLAPFGWPLGWRATAGYRHFLEGNLFDVRDLVPLGGSLEIEVGESLPVVRTLSVNGIVIVGGAIFGWSVGAGFSF